MTKLQNHLWVGISGMDYEYWVCPINANLADRPGNYIFATKTASDEWQALYIGEADSLKFKARGHDGEESALSKGATHLHIHLRSVTEEEREIEVADLIAFNNPVCNPSSKSSKEPETIVEFDTLLTVSPPNSSVATNAAEQTSTIKEQPAEQAPANANNDDQEAIFEVDTFLTVAPHGASTSNKKSAKIETPAQTKYRSHVAMETEAVPAKKDFNQESRLADQVATTPESHEWSGLENAIYKYWIFSMDTKFAPEPGNFIFAGLDRNNEWRALYIGHSADMSAEDFASNPVIRTAVTRGATHIHVHKSSSYSLTRRVENEDLISRHKPPFNS